MVDGEIGLGDLLFGECSICCHFGRVTNIHRSQGTRKGWLYTIQGVGSHSYFADQIKHWWWKELQVLIKEKYGDNYIYKDKPKITYQGEKYLVDSVTFFENFRAVLWNPKAREFKQVPLYMLRDKTLERLVNQYKKEQIY